MLHGIINEQGNCLDVRADISEKRNNIFHMFTYKSLASRILIVGILVIADKKPMALC